MKIYTFKELKESKLIFDRKAPPFGIIMTLLTLFLVVSILLIASFSTKNYIVKANGIVTSQDKINVMNSVSGNIKNIYVEEGEELDIGDIILEIDAFQIDIQIEQLDGSINFLNAKINNTYKLINFIDNYSLDNENSLLNPFDNSINEEKQYYASAKQFSIGKEEAAKLLEYISAYYENNETELFATDIGSWTLKITDTDGHQYEKTGSMCGGVTTGDIDLTDYIKKNIHIENLEVFGGDFEEEDASEQNSL